jgi:lipoprotein-anchoring transpeptidase ErfK/SrfK
MIPTIENQMKKMTALTSVLLMATAEALAQEKMGRPARRIVVSIPDRKLVLIDSGKVVKIYLTAVGAPKSPSPTGTFKVVRRVVDPTWSSNGKVIGPGKFNPVGTRWIGLSIKGYGIHGTNVPSSIGRNASHGCIRMRNHDVEELYTMVSVGDQVELYGDRTPELDRILGDSAATAETVASQR